MIVGVIGSGSIGPDLAYGFVSALAKGEGGKVFLLDIRQEALDAGMKRIGGYIQKGLSRGKISPKIAKLAEAGLQPTRELSDLADCDYVLEAATEDLVTKQKILAGLESVVRSDCLIGFATSGLPRSRIAAEVQHPERCFVNHPFFPAWRSTPMEVVLSGDDGFGERMIDTLKLLGKVPIITTDVPCFAADDIFCNYCAEAARIFTEGVATPAQVDQIVNDAIGGGGPFNVMDLTRGNLLNIHCLELMRDADTGSQWFDPPAIFAEQANTPWHDRQNPGDPSYDEALGKTVLDRILAVLLGRTYFVVDNGICHPREFNWMSRNALGFGQGLLDLAADLGVDRVHDICTAYAADHPGFEISASIANKQLVDFSRNIETVVDDGIAVVTIRRPEVMNALNEQTMEELKTEFARLAADDRVKGIVLTSYDGSLAGADIMELAALKTTAEAEAKCVHGQAILAGIAATPKPVVAAVGGPVLGGGAEISMSCHARVAGPGLMLGQPEVNLGIIPGYGGTQRLPRLIGLERGIDLLRTGRPVFAVQACEWGWASGEPATDFVAAAKDLIHRHLAGEVKLAPVDPAPMTVPAELPALDIGHHSLVIDAILVEVIRDGLSRPLAEGLQVEAAGFARCKETVDYDIGMKNFIQNGPRVPAAFMHE
ncbi:MAG: 3-hydroxyacyl-CoA dehydrogenase/enoyl-CoA hydratase family protein [bacterium]